MNIVTAHLKFAFGTGIAITIILMITWSLVGGLAAPALTTHDVYLVGRDDGCADIKSQSNTYHNFYSHDNYDHHSSDYMKGYNHGLVDCISQDPYNTIDMNHNAYKNNNNDNNPSPVTTTPATNNQGQTINQRVFCVVSVGICNVISGQAQNLNNN